MATDRITLAELVDDLKDGLDEAIDAANSITSRLEDATRDIREELTPAFIGRKLELAQAALDLATRITLDLKQIREDKVEDPGAGLEGLDLDEIEDFARELEEAETAEDDDADRRYHEAKDEGKLK